MVCCVDKVFPITGPITIVITSIGVLLNNQNSDNIGTMNIKLKTSCSQKLCSLLEQPVICIGKIFRPEQNDVFN